MSVQGSTPAAHEAALDLGDYLAWISSGRWYLAAFLAAALCVGALYLFLAPPIYVSDALVQVESRAAGGPDLGPLTDLLGGGSEVATEVEVIRSRAVLGAVIDSLRLDISVTPDYVPLLGAAVARRYVGDGPAEPPLGIGERFAWGGERIEVSELTVPDFLMEAELTLEIGDAGRHRLLDDEERVLLEPTSGVTARATVSDAQHAWRQGELVITVANVSARPGQRFTLVRHSRQQAVMDLQQALHVGEVGRDTGILRIAYSGKESQRVYRIVAAVASQYVRQNAERLSAEADNMLQFTRTQLPALRANVEDAERALNNYRASKGSVDVSREIQGMLEKVAAIETAISERELERAELRQRFTAEHPRLLALQEKVTQLQGERDGLNRRLRALPSTEWDTVRLMRDAKVASELYVLLLNKTQELAVAKAGTIGNARLLDTASVPEEPLSPRPAVVMVQSLLAGLLLGLGFVVGRRLINTTVFDPDTIEAKLGAPVYASVLHSKAQRQLGGGGDGLIANVFPDDPAVESLRSLRTSLQFALADARNRMVCVSGPTPGVGKSFISANLAAVLAAGGKRVLLIDADLRRGALQKMLGVARAPGLSEVLSQEARLDAALTMPAPRLWFLPTGTLPPSPGELLMSERLNQLLVQVARDYDLVILDTPPVLPVADAGIIARHCGVVFVVVRAGRHSVREVETSLKRFAQNGVPVTGVVFNDLPVAEGRYGYGSGYESYTTSRTASRDFGSAAKAWLRRAGGR